MTIIGAWENSKEFDLKKITIGERIQILQQHREALKNDPMWSMFGGIITIGNRTFQVVATNDELAA